MKRIRNMAFLFLSAMVILHPEPILGSSCDWNFQATGWDVVCDWPCEGFCDDMQRACELEPEWWSCSGFPGVMSFCSEAVGNCYAVCWCAAR